MTTTMLSTNHFKANNLNKIHGFTLFEIIISMVVLGGVLTIMFSGFSISNKLFSQTSFESEASLIAEREMEYLKSELLSGFSTNKKTNITNKFKLEIPWELSSLIEPDSIDNCYRISVKVKKQEQSFLLSSFIYSPTKEEKNEG